LTRRRACGGETAKKRQKEGQMAKAIGKGGMAPDFVLPTDGGSHCILSAHRGNNAFDRIDENEPSPRRKQVNTT